MTGAGSGGRTWAARLDARLAGLGYARGPASGRVTGLAVEPGLVTARVRDGAPTPWTVRIELPVLTDAEWRRAERALVADSDAREQLLDGELPPDADALFARAGLPLLPAGDGEPVLECDCPDWALPCAHLTAVLAALGAAIDDEPFLLTTWRGRDRRAVLDAVRNGPPPVPLDDGPPTDGGFWECGDLPDRRAAAPAPAVAELGRPAVSVRGRTLTDTLAPAYEAFLTW
ncbi:hypothetical protein ACIOC1_25920 [Streptomyces sp. NPDC088197]|uniref:SWIM zinc finger family protein n=1 Tax=Streptomyces sp. NPDC088197 TaxID=3365840 RepID=UPI0038043B3F